MTCGDIRGDMWRRSGCPIPPVKRGISSGPSVGDEEALGLPAPSSLGADLLPVAGARAVHLRQSPDHLPGAGFQAIQLTAGLGEALAHPLDGLIEAVKVLLHGGEHVQHLGAAPLQSHAAKAHLQAGEQRAQRGRPRDQHPPAGYRWCS